MVIGRAVATHNHNPGSHATANFLTAVSGPKSVAMEAWAVADHGSLTF